MKAASVSLLQHFFERYKQYARGKLRVWGSWLALLVLAKFVKQNPSGDGIALITLGATIRFFASGFIDKEGRLSVGGPYAYCRNPLYLGSFLIAFGAAISQHDSILLVIICALNFLLYYPLILAEEDVLKVKFQNLYADYVNTVPRFFPWKFWTWFQARDFSQHSPRLNNPQFRWAKIKENKGYEGFFTAAGVILFLYVVAYLKSQ